jgi:SAM-dependent methyltransferase
MGRPREDARERARELARRHLAEGDAVGWFEAFYAEAGGAAERIPWADLAPNPWLLEWLDAHPEVTGRALVVGCGLGDDAELLASRGWPVTAFDVSASAVAWCRKRFPASPVEYVAADLLAPPAAWRRAFAFVFEANTLQVLPADLRASARERLADLLAPVGRMLLVARAREASEPEGRMPWPLTRGELARFVALGLVEESLEVVVDAREEPPLRRFKAVYRA